MKVTNTNEFTYAVGYPNDLKSNYVFEPGETKVNIPNEHRPLFDGLNGFIVEEENGQPGTQEENMPSIEQGTETLENQPETPEQPKEETHEVFKCPDCGNEFTAKIAMLGHMRSHPKEENGTNTN
jgi:hypothetical protein